MYFRFLRFGCFAASGVDDDAAAAATAAAEDAHADADVDLDADLDADADADTSDPESAGDEGGRLATLLRRSALPVSSADARLCGATGAIVVDPLLAMRFLGCVLGDVEPHWTDDCPTGDDAWMFVNGNWSILANAIKGLTT